MVILAFIVIVNNIFIVNLRAAVLDFKSVSS